MKSTSLKRIKGESGQAVAAEFALILPMLLGIVCGIIDFGWFFYNQLSLDNACRDAARYAIVSMDSSNSEVEIDALEQEIQSRSRMLNVKEHLKNFQVEIVPQNDDVLKDHITVSLKADMPALTPVMCVIKGGMTYTIESDVTMRIETVTSPTTPGGT